MPSVPEYVEVAYGFPMNTPFVSSSISFNPAHFRSPMYWYAIRYAM